MFIRLYWWLFDIKYCNGCHTMTSQYKDVFGAITCKKCNSCNCSRNYRTIIDKTLNNKHVKLNDGFTTKFVCYLISNYYKSGGIIIHKESNQIIEPEEIYVEFLWQIKAAINNALNKHI